MKKFLVISFAIFSFAFLTTETASAQSCRWRGGNARYYTSDYSYAPSYRYRRSRRYSRRVVRRYPGGVSVTYVTRRRVYYPYTSYRRAAWYW
jgi:hypothetical protein